MALLPPIRPLITLRPGRDEIKSTHFIFKSENKKIHKIYEAIRILNPQSPVEEDKFSIDHFFGCFGYRFNPSTCMPRSFHSGIDMTAKQHTKVYPIAGGIFEYSGYAIKNGQYILLSHPDIVSEDGFVLYSAYMNLQKRFIDFTKYQKMLREISFHSYPTIPIPRSMQIASVGNSAYSVNVSHHLHLQFELRHKDGTTVVIDPALVLHLKQRKNKTHEIKTKKAFKEFYLKNEKALKKWYPHWHSKIKGF